MNTQNVQNAAAIATHEDSPVGRELADSAHQKVRPTPLNEAALVHRLSELDLDLFEAPRPAPKPPERYRSPLRERDHMRVDVLMFNSARAWCKRFGQEPNAVPVGVLFDKQAGTVELIFADAKRPSCGKI